MKADEIMSSPVIAVRPVEPLAHAKNLMIRHKINRLVVVEKGEPVGFLSMCDIARSLSEGTAGWRRRPIDQIQISRVMHKGVIAVSPHTGLNKVAEIMLKQGISSLVVRENSKLLGIVTKTDTLKFFTENMNEKMKVANLMTPNPVTVNLRHSISRVLEIMEQNNVARVIVVKGDRPIGMITGSDIGFAQIEAPAIGPKTREVRYTRKLERAGRPRARYVKHVALLTAEDVMTRDPTTIDAYDDVTNAANIMLEKGISGLPVMDKKSLVGILTKTDIVKGISRLGIE